MARPGLDFPAKDLPLRDDVRTLGALVGEVIREQEGEAVFAAVEAARKAAIRRREEPEGEGERRLLEQVGALAPAEAERLVRSFAAYFQVVNLAEKIHRIRRRRDYLRRPEAEGGPQPFSLEDTLGKLAAAGLDRPRLEALLGRLHIEPVFTAHPTEATRRTLLEKQQTIARALVDRLDPSRTPPEERAAMARIRAEVTAGWQTEEQPEERPTVGDEAEHVLFYVTDVLYRILPVFYEGLERALGGLDSGGGDSEPRPPGSEGTWTATPTSPPRPSRRAWPATASWRCGSTGARCWPWPAVSASRCPGWGWTARCWSASRPTAGPSRKPTARSFPATGRCPTGCCCG
jgi:phosphoenolpyruvate carboxylase